MLGRNEDSSRPLLLFAQDDERIRRDRPVALDEERVHVDLRDLRDLDRHLPDGLNHRRQSSAVHRRIASEGAQAAVWP